MHHLEKKKPHAIKAVTLTELTYTKIYFDCTATQQNIQKSPAEEQSDISAFEARLIQMALYRWLKAPVHVSAVTCPNLTSNKLPANGFLVSTFGAASSSSSFAFYSLAYPPHSVVH